MNTIKIYAKYTANHLGIYSLIKYPPEKVRFVLDSAINRTNNIENSKNLYKSKIRDKLFNQLKNLYERIIEIFNLPRILPVISIKEKAYDYILTNCLVLSNRKFICLIEYIGGLVNFYDHKLSSPICYKLIKKFLLSKRCKYIFTWSESAKKMIIEFLKIPEKKRFKFQSIIPSIKPKSKIIRKNTKIRLLFISSIATRDREFNFYMKGGKLVLQAYEKLKSKYNNLELIFVGYVPEKYKEYFQKIPNIKFFLKIPYEEILEYYKKSDIFLFPTYGDVFGFTFIEAMAFGLPTICINNNSAATELVINNTTGFVINTSQKFLCFPFSKYFPEWVGKRIYYKNLRNEDDLIGLDNLLEKLEILIQNKELRQKFGKNGRERIENGDLSIEFRNQKLTNLLFKNF